MDHVVRTRRSRLPGARGAGARAVPGVREDTVVPPGETAEGHDRAPRRALPGLPLCGRAVAGGGVGGPVRSVRAGAGRVEGAGGPALRGVPPAGVATGRGGRGGGGGADITSADGGLVVPSGESLRVRRVDQSGRSGRSRSGRVLRRGGAAHAARLRNRIQPLDADQGATTPSPPRWQCRSRSRGRGPARRQKARNTSGGDGRVRRRTRRTPRCRRPGREAGRTGA